MFYFTGVRWGNSERTFGVVIPAKGELAWVTPAFEEQRARELIKFSNDVRTWQEDESPYRRIAEIVPFTLARPRVPETMSDPEFVRVKARTLEVFRREMKA